MASIIFKVLSVLLSVSCVTSNNQAREAYQRTVTILQVVERIEEQLSKEDRLRGITDIVRIDSNMDRINKKLDRLAAMFESGPRTSESVTALSTSAVDLDHRLQSLDERMERIEKSMDLRDGGLTKLDEIEKRTAQMKDDLNQKLRKMMNIITALYDMSKDMKSNFGARTVVAHRTPETPNFASEFLIENLEELERKIKEQFSVLINEVRNEITGLKIVASNVGGDCSSKTFDDDDEEFNREVDGLNTKKKLPRSSNHGDKEADQVTDTLATLARTTREIRDEIHLGIQSLDDKLTNMTQVRQRCDELEPSASVISASWSPNELQPQQQQVLPSKDKKSRSHEACTRRAENVKNPSSCAELRKGGANCDGVYVIFPKNVRAVRVFCDMTTDGGGWTVLMRRGNFEGKLSTSFHKNWLSYKNGFGDVEGEFWLGNDVMNLLTAEDETTLMVHLEAFDGDDVNLTYSTFKVGNESSAYQLRVGPSVGGATPASNSLRYHNNHPFSTFDKKNDQFEQNCAATYKGGWWFNGCYFGFLNGEYFRPEDKRENWQGILWYDWKGNASLKGAQMMIRPKNFTH